MFSKITVFPMPNQNKALLMVQSINSYEGQIFPQYGFLLCTAAKTRTKVSLALICQFTCMSSCKYSVLAKVMKVEETDCSYPLTQQMKMSWGYLEKTRTDS